jgi:hypothetical protein
MSKISDNISRIIFKADELIDDLSKLALMNKTINVHEASNSLVSLIIQLEKYKEKFND